MKKQFIFLSSLLILCSMAIFTSCSKDEEVVIIKPTGISLDKTTLALLVGETGTLTATVVPTDAANKNVIWSTENAAVATVADGVVTSIAEGTTNIVVTTEEGGFVAKCAVTVTQPAGLTINFGSTTWTAALSNFTEYPSNNILDIWAFKTDESSFPILNFVAPSSTGVTTYTDGGNYYFEYYESTYLTDENDYTYGDWWAQSGSVNITSFDGATISGTANVVMFNAKAKYVDGDTNPETRVLTLAFNKVPAQVAGVIQASIKKSIIQKRNVNGLRIAK